MGASDMNGESIFGSHKIIDERISEAKFKAYCVEFDQKNFDIKLFPKLLEMC